MQHIEDGNPAPPLDGDETEITSDWLARVDGYDSHADYEWVRKRITIAALVVVRNRERIGDPCLTWVDLEDSLLDRYGAGLLPFPAAVRGWTACATIKATAREVWGYELDYRRAMEARRVAELESSDARDADRAHALAEEVAA